MYIVKEVLPDDHSVLMRGLYCIIEKELELDVVPIDPDEQVKAFPSK